jgi:hypothetical protein
MTSLTVDAATLATLSQATDLAEIRDAGGNIVGYFTPAAQAAEPIAPFDAAEVERRKNSPGRPVTTIELFEHLLSLAETEEQREDLQRHIREITERHIREITGRNQCDTP